MLRLTNVFYLLLVAVGASEPELLGALQKSFARGMKFARYDVKTSYNDVKKYVERSILEMQFELPYQPTYWNDDLLSKHGSTVVEPTAECYAFLRNPEPSRRRQAIECTKLHLKVAKHRRQRLNKMYNNTLVRLKEVASAAKNCHKIEYNNTLSLDLMASKCLIEARTRLDSIVKETKSTFLDVSKNAIRSVTKWIVLGGRCVASADDPSMLLEWFQACKHNIQRSRNTKKYKPSIA